MRKFLAWAWILPVAIFLVWTIGAAEESTQAADWSMNATVIEACSCPMFCQCYFNSEPAEHGAHAGHEGHEKGHFCKFNMAYKVNEGHHGDVDLAGVKFWLAGDLGSEFDDMRADWAALHFDPSVTEEQRAGIGHILGHVYPVEWDSFEIRSDAKIHWKANDDKAVAKADDGKVGEMVLTRTQGMTDDPVVVDNLRYWAVPRHEGFVLMPNEVEAYKVGDKAFEYRGTNGFMITLDISSDDVEQAAPAK